MVEYYKPHPEIDETYTALVPCLAATGIQYVHLVDHSAMGAPKVPEELKRARRGGGSPGSRCPTGCLPFS